MYLLIYTAAKQINNSINLTYNCMLIRINILLRRIVQITLLEYIWHGNGIKEMILRTYADRKTTHILKKIY